ncbi:poly-beta-1,6-N-acetyl-D-glucosamine biosynthesis protein PgaD [Priestia megaterium]|uniref:poly-beta-1,6-N-acetyl-D-glucosamine biosynthesis protein PgaD n=1 Tax=Priestia megaterium TaxID=1404 RepID=UPI003D961C34
MEQSRPRLNEEQIMIQAKQPLARLVISIIISSVFWLYCAIVLWFFLSAVIGVNDRYSGVLKIAFKTTNGEIRTFLVIGLAIFCFFFLALFLWRFYNKKRFGSLNRRKEPAYTSIKDLERLELLSKKQIQELQRAQYIEFNVNPLKHTEERKHA